MIIILITAGRKMSSCKLWKEEQELLLRQKRLQNLQLLLLAVSTALLDLVLFLKLLPCGWCRNCQSHNNRRRCVSILRRRRFRISHQAQQQQQCRQKIRCGGRATEAWGNGLGENSLQRSETPLDKAPGCGWGRSTPPKKLQPLMILQLSRCVDPKRTWTFSPKFLMHRLSTLLPQLPWIMLLPHLLLLQ